MPELLALAGFPERGHRLVELQRREHGSDFAGFDAWSGPVGLDALIATQRTWLFSPDSWNPQALVQAVTLADRAVERAEALELPRVQDRARQTRDTLLTAMGTPAPAPLGDWPAELAGTWVTQTSYRTLSLRFQHVEGRLEATVVEHYAAVGFAGRLTGFERVDPQTARFEWNIGEYTGWAELEPSADGQFFEGRWGYEGDTVGYAWRGRRIEWVQQDPDVDGGPQPEDPQTVPEPHPEPLGRGPQHTHDGADAAVAMVRV